MADLWLALPLAALGGYLLGGVPFGLVLTRLAGLGDIRAIGSGNIGATNVLRTGRKDLALLTLLLDSGKGAIAALGVRALLGWEGVDPILPVVAGVAAVIGHNYPVWLRFRGGKGVATTLGVLLATAWPVGGLACLTWVVMAGVFRYSSLAALAALALAPAYAWALAAPVHVAGFGLLAVLAWWRHRDNIRRLLAGTETKIGQKSKAKG
ncbi:glycerol-3-phosphate 1-O-acyltransferase PlsY [Roseospira navarrensis]|uniref:Glycerol-3-phosphate acyltransferase n=1 Tax=Roseospira navarrensis TaxID=140058 RepID=A0A7X1ZEI7_9PROT|nr:glycerol-3-phosphate 1-O-acyltransferase PlsY [Roseospira navarrensis]MQX35790.1 glycerol-3-phosphate 1-O-acyltransferase PlsY [Roseospira navarrensis]